MRHTLTDDSMAQAMQQGQSAARATVSGPYVSSEKQQWFLSLTGMTLCQIEKLVGARRFLLTPPAPSTRPHACCLRQHSRCRRSVPLFARALSVAA